MALYFVVDLIDISHFILDWMNIKLSRILYGGQLEEETGVIILLDIMKNIYVGLKTVKKALTKIFNDPSFTG